MGKFSFRYLLQEECKCILPQMFDILYTNMMSIAPSNAGYNEDRNMWLSYIQPTLEQGHVKVLLMFAGEELAGYFQYSIRGDTMLVDEVEIKPVYQRTMLFYRCGQFLLNNFPDGIQHLESYVNKNNRNSLSIHRKLDMEIIGENRSGRSWRFRGNVETISKHFIR